MKGSDENRVRYGLKRQIGGLKMKTKKAEVIAAVKKIRALRVSIKAAQEEEKALVETVKEYLTAQALEELPTAEGTAILRHVAVASLTISDGDAVQHAIKHGAAIETLSPKKSAFADVFPDLVTFAERIDLRISYKQTKDK